MRSALKWTLRGVAAVVAIMLLLFATLALVLNSESGTRWILDRANVELPGELAYGDFEGALWTGLRFETLAYSDAERVIEARAFELEINWSSLAAGRLTLKKVIADELVVTLLGEPSTEATPLEIPFQALPLDISITRAAVNTLRVVNAAGTSTISDISIDRARLDGVSLRVRNAVAATSGARVNALNLAVTLKGDIPATGTVSWQLDGEPWSGQGDFRGTLAELNFRQSVAGPYSGIVAGSVKLLHRTEPLFDALVNWELWQFGSYGLRDGEVRLTGVVQDYEASYDLTVTASGNDDYQVNGTLDGADITQWTVNTSVSGDIGQILATADVIREADTMRLRNLDLSGTVRGAPISASGEVMLAASESICTGCELRLGDNRLGITGGMKGDVLELALSLDAPTLNTLLPDYSGAVRGEANVSGSLEQPRFRVRLQGSDLYFEETELGAATITGGGDLETVNVVLAWQRQTVTLDAEALIVRAADMINGTLKSARVTEEESGRWVLQGATPFTVSGNDVTVSEHRWQGEIGRLTVSRFSMLNDDIDVLAVLSDIPLKLAEAFMPENYQLLGSANASIQLRRAANVWSGVVDWSQTDTVLRVVGINEQVTDVQIPRAEARAEIVGGMLTGTAALAIEPGVLGELSIELDALTADAGLRAELNVSGADWGWLSAVVPQIDRFDGPITAKVSASGPLKAPELSGNASWTDGSILIPAMNVELKQINLLASGASQGTANLTGSAMAGGGSLSVEGKFEDLMLTTRSVTIRVTGDNAELLNWPEYRLWATPEITVVGNADGWTLNGSVFVPRADIALKEIPEEAVTVSDDVTVLGEEEEETLITRASGEAQLTLGDQVRFTALGLDTRLLGSLKLRLPRNRPLRATGRVTLADGTFTAYGQQLTIQEGTLTFTGPLDDPIVNVRAVRVIDSLDGIVTAGIHLRGRASDLTSTVYAEPTMAEANALSYLIIGRPLSQATASEGGELSGAAVALGLRQATRVTDQIGQAFGLDQLSLAGDGGDTTALVAGKQVNTRLYARYAYGVFSRLGTLLLRYRLSRRMTLEAGAGENQSIDVLYSVEK